MPRTKVLSIISRDLSTICHSNQMLVAKDYMQLSIEIVVN